MKKDKNAALINLRDIIGKTQSEFAAMLGVSKDTVVSWELGRSWITEKAAMRIHRVTGARPDDLVGGKKNIRYFNREKYDANHFKAWVERFKENAQVAEMMFDIASQELRLILLASAKPHYKIKGRLHAVHESFINWMKDTVNNFKLDSELKPLLKVFPIKSKYIFPDVSRLPTWEHWLPDAEVQYHDAKTTCKK